MISTIAFFLFPVALTLSACSESTNYHAAVSIFQGVAAGEGDFNFWSTCSIDIECIAGSGFTFPTPCDAGVAGTVTWLAEVGTTYYVYVHGGSSFQSSSGTYELNLVDEFDVFEANDFCQQGITLVLEAESTNSTDGGNSSFPVTIPTGASTTASGSTVRATVDITSLGNVGNPFWSDCETSFLSQSPGLFYRVEGYGGPLQVSTCSAATDYNAAITVFAGSCGELECETQQVFNSSTCSLGGTAISSSRRRNRRQLRKFHDMISINPDLVPVNRGSRRKLRRLEEVFTTNHGADSLSWLSLPFETYHILVHGEVLDDVADTGSFELTVKPITMASFFCQQFMVGVQQEDPFAECTCTETAGTQGNSTTDGGGLGGLFGLGDGEFFTFNGLAISCTSPCQYCNADSTLCIEDVAIEASFDGASGFGMETNSFKYVVGRTESVTYSSDGLGNCTITVDDITCSNCKVISCLNGDDGVELDCPELPGGLSNFATCSDVFTGGNSTFTTDQETSSPMVNGTFLEALYGDGFEECLNYEPPPPIEESTGTPPVNDTGVEFVDTPSPAPEPTKEPAEPEPVAAPTKKSGSEATFSAVSATAYALLGFLSALGFV